MNLLELGETVLPFSIPSYKNLTFDGNNLGLFLSDAPQGFYEDHRHHEWKRLCHKQLRQVHSSYFLF
ncbi:hypothetical protein [Nitrosomonas ureae]|uniref:Uncharacterized protein n=1 Tax=Nitrosomonas ureae TaxID=44577 RepID=A0A1H8ZGQ4_9PROT|nr:hypothetical protein [Nitrosomonas ureae]SEP63586.1 hypothetical protein SAMN05421510_100137 [Nitrosomonas ureae]